MDDIPADAPRPRLCHLKKWSDFNGYGFNLHAERGKAGQFVGTIDEGSPSQAADLRAGDRIVEVNGTNIGSENHQQVVQRIKAVPTETKLLVVDAEADDYYKDRKIVVSGELPNVDYHETPDINPYTHHGSDINASLDNVKLSSSPDYDTYKPRLCRLRSWSDFSGYGFNLHADRSTPGQYIGKVDDASPAEAAGLLSNDRIIEVNGNPVVGMSHAEVVASIKTIPGEVSLLVVDREVEEHYRNAGVEVRGSMPGIDIINCPSVNPNRSAVSANGSATEHEHVHSASLAVEDIHEETHHAYQEDYQDHREDRHSATGSDNYRPPSPADLRPPSPDIGGEYEETDAPFRAREDSPVAHYEAEVKHEPVVIAPAASIKTESFHSASSTSSNSSTPLSASASGGKPVVVGGLEFAGSAKEARERMKKKGNVKQDASLSLKDKYDILQKL